ncbi:MAG: flagellar motor protein MotB [Tissierellales bacterium]
MARKRKKIEVKKGSPAWMNTYGDMVTLLLCFFVLLFSFSSVDAQKFKAIMNSFKGSSGVLIGGETVVTSDIGFDSKTKGFADGETFETDVTRELQGLAMDLNDYLEEEGISELQVSIDYNESFVRLSFLDGILFDPGKATIKEEAIQILDIVGVKLLQFTNNKIKIEGHTDTVPMNSPQFPNNWYLSAARAITVAEYYISEKGFDPKRLTAEGFGEYSPIDTNDTAEGRIKNRRIEIKILSSIFNEKANTNDG